MRNGSSVDVVEELVPPIAAMKGRNARHSMVLAGSALPGRRNALDSLLLLLRKMIGLRNQTAIDKWARRRQAGAHR